MLDFLYTPIDNIQGIGKKRVELYNKLDIFSIYDILTYYPIRYIDFSDICFIDNIDSTKVCSIKAVVIDKTQLYTKKMIVYKVIVKDSTSSLTINIFNNKYLYNSLIVGKEYIFHGKVVLDLLGKTMSNPSILDMRKTKNLIKPIYHSSGTLKSNIIENNVKTILDILESKYDIEKDFLDKSILEKFVLVNIFYAFKNIHFPSNKENLEKARKRFIFDEMFYLQSALKFLKNKNTNKIDMKKDIKTDIFFNQFKDLLPFDLMEDQIKVINECISDISSGYSMNRLVQGDVGCGKTVVAMAVCFILAKNGFQSCMMVPTEVLAKQHYQTFMKLIGQQLNVSIITSSTKKKHREKIYYDIKNHNIDILIGTHSLINDKLSFKNLALIVTDEQHRFGVKQRIDLIRKSKYQHSMIMSATPIPRTLALIIYGDLDISVIRTSPKGRQIIESYGISPNKRERAFDFIRKLLEKGQQGYFICPLIEADEENIYSKFENVIDYSKKLQTQWFKDYNIGILHGKMKSSQKNKILEDFNNKKYDILVSTTVIEVGIDVKNATFIVIENAECFGLSTLHQLRGRVGRNDLQSYCIFICHSSSENTIKRLKSICETSDGFKLSQIDLEMRGPGEFFGSRQHGLPSLKIANLSSDLEFIQKINEFSSLYLKSDPNLSSDKNKYIRKNIENMFNKNNNIFN